MPINRKNKAQPHVTGRPPERPPLDEWSLIRAEIAAAVAQIRAELRSGPSAELIREVEDEMEHPHNRRREYEEKILGRKRALREKKKAARWQRMSGPR